jgi:hypothetical protein
MGCVAFAIFTWVVCFGHADLAAFPLSTRILSTSPMYSSSRLGTEISALNQPSEGTHRPTLSSQIVRALTCLLTQSLLHPLVSHGRSRRRALTRSSTSPFLFPSLISALPVPGLPRCTNPDQPHRSLLRTSPPKHPREAGRGIRQRDPRPLAQRDDFRVLREMRGEDREGARSGGQGGGGGSSRDERWKRGGFGRQAETWDAFERVGEGADKACIGASYAVGSAGERALG